MCKIKKAISRGLGLEKKAAPDPVVAAPADTSSAPTQAALDAQREQLTGLMAQQQENNAAFQASQKAYLDEVNRYNQERSLAAAATTVSPPPAAPTISTSGVDDSPVDDADSNVDSKRRGRRALRIDLNSPNTAGPSGGLNIPRG